MSDRFERFQILDFLWKAHRTATTRNPGIENSLNISDSLKIEQVKIQSHLETLKDQRLISIIIRTRSGGWSVKIIGSGTIWIENFFMELEKELGKSEDVEIKNHMKKIDQENDIVMKHELRMQFLITTSEVLKFVNTLLSKLGF